MHVFDSNALYKSNMSRIFADRAVLPVNTNARLNTYLSLPPPHPSYKNVKKITNKRDLQMKHACTCSMQLKTWKEAIILHDRPLSSVRCIIGPWMQCYLTLTRLNGHLRHKAVRFPSLSTILSSQPAAVRNWRD